MSELRKAITEYLAAQDAQRGAHEARLAVGTDWQALDKRMFAAGARLVELLTGDDDFDETAYNSGFLDGRESFLADGIVAPTASREAVTLALTELPDLTSERTIEDVAAAMHAGRLTGCAFTAGRQACSTRDHIEDARSYMNERRAALVDKAVPR